MPADLPALLVHRTCFLFDLDGTLVDSNSCHESAYLTALNAFRPDLVPGFRYERYKGWRTTDAVADMGVTDAAVRRALTDAKQASYRAQVEAGEVELLPGAKEALGTLRQAGRRIFLVTGGSRRSTAAVLGRLGVTDLFEYVVTGDDIVNCKPDPECYLKCVRDAAIPRAEALVIEDALAGVESARAAGLAVIAVNNPELSSQSGLRTGLPEYAGSIADLAAALAAVG